MGGIFSFTILCSARLENGGRGTDRLEMAAFDVGCAVGDRLAGRCAFLYLLHRFPVVAWCISASLFFNGYQSHYSGGACKHGEGPSACDPICGWYRAQKPRWI